MVLARLLSKNNRPKRFHPRASYKDWKRTITPTICPLPLHTCHCPYFPFPLYPLPFPLTFAISHLSISSVSHFPLSSAAMAVTVASWLDNYRLSHCYLLGFLEPSWAFVTSVASVAAWLLWLLLIWISQST